MLIYKWQVARDVQYEGSAAATVLTDLFLVPGLATVAEHAPISLSGRNRAPVKFTLPYPCDTAVPLDLGIEVCFGCAILAANVLIPAPLEF